MDTYERIARHLLFWIVTAAAVCCVSAQDTCEAGCEVSR